MEEFQHSYRRLCKESGAEPQETVLQQLQELPRGRLDLATQSLTVETCRALGKLLQKEALLTELILSDCMLSEEGATLLLQGLCANTVVRFLDLKGNNLQAAGAEALGQLLRQNKSIQSLTLEWNNLGPWEDAFAAFCGALAGNGALRQLDLRNNQISHKGAEELALALTRNAHLQQLDLRWNSIGLLGGRALVNCLPRNRTLWRLELAGNNVPGDILRAVEQAMDHNQERQTTSRENRARTHVLSKEVQHLQEEKSRASAACVGQLQEALNERHSIINALKAKLQMAEAALALSEQKAQGLGELLAMAEQEQRSLAQRQAKERRLEQQVGRRAGGQAVLGGVTSGAHAPSHPQEAAERESKLLRDLSAANEKHLLLRNQVDELERKVRSQQEQLFLARQELTNTAAELKIRAVQAEERLELEKKRSRQSLEDVEQLRAKEVEHMTRHLEESERAMQERVQRLEASRLSLEEELSRVKAAALSERGQAEEELIKAKNQVRLEEQQRLAHLEEKLRLLAQARDEAQSACLQQRQTVADAQARASQLSLQVEGLRRRLEELQQELSNKDQEKVAEVTRVRVELREQNGRLQAELTAQEALKEKVAALERQLKVMASDHREALLDRESENASLREKLRLKEAEIARIREEEAQRASFLQNAVLAYVQGSPLRALSPQK
ncbi:leucine-rich repeat-containing protein 45 isoform X7 [Ursus maritimus]|uniref:Leucine-rich repeat-containing protein 45 isoform X7 n=1 Tax=Ursus maritimus TaxID=29073 RepID=A0A8M1GJQ0_URSMA|nr:leucine-rich repeat-containing protein 45 isoform X7 [Ursus maritimus]